MPINIEIKARVPDWSRLVSAADSVSDTPVEVLEQEDVFFAAREGRLKLRTFFGGQGELILYQRPDGLDPRPSRYRIAPTSDPATLRAILESTLDDLAVVRKTRLLYRVGQTRIHLDRVEGLGEFVELEVVLDDDQPERDGVTIATALMHRLGLERYQFVKESYLDLALKLRQSWSR